MLKFPLPPKGAGDNSYLCVGNTPFAKHNILQKTFGLQTGFLTEHTLFFIIKGEKRFHFNGSVLTVHDNELIIMKRGLYTISEQLSTDGTFEALMLFLPEKYLGKIAAGMESNGSSPAGDYVVVTKNAVISNFQDAYLSLFGSNLKRLDALLPLKLQEIFLLLSCTAYREQIAALLHSCMNVSQVDIEFIVKENIFKPLTVPDYARLCSRSVASFKRDFEKIFQSAPKKWIREQRLKHSDRLLKTSQTSIADIALACGFESTSHFIKAYKEYFNQTPGKARAE